MSDIYHSELNSKKNRQIYEGARGKQSILQEGLACEPEKGKAGAATKKSSTSFAAELNNGLSLDTHDFFKDTITHPAARARQTAVVAWGAVAGGIKDIPNEIGHHLSETAHKVVEGLAVGTVVGALAATESPLVAGGLLVGGGILLGVAFKNTWDKGTDDPELSKALSASWRSSDSAIMKNSMRVAERQLGPEAFNYGLSALAGGLGAKYGTKFLLDDATWGIVPPGPPWIKQADGTQMRSEFGMVSTRFPDGTLKNVTSSGYTRISHPGGAVTRLWPNGVKVLENNFKTEVYYPDGRKVFVSPFGNRKTTLPSGTIIDQAPDGYTSILRPDGSSTTKYVDGSTCKNYVNGDWLLTDSRGRKTFYCEAERKLYEVKPGGEKQLVEFK
jgi:hypothetical protein